MKKGDRRIRVDVLEKRTVDGKEVKVKVGEKDIYVERPYAGNGFFNISWEDRNRMARPDSKRQQKLKEAGKQASKDNLEKLQKEQIELEKTMKTIRSVNKQIEEFEKDTSKSV